MNVEPTLSQITIKAVGDVMPGSITPKKILPPFNGKIFVDSVSHYLKGSDLTMGNLEGTFITDTMKSEKCPDSVISKGTCYAFGIPVKLAVDLKGMNFNVLSLDNNHSNDYGKEGYLLTKQTLQSLDIKYLQKSGFTKLNIHGKEIAIVPFGFSGNSYKIYELKKESEIIKELKSKNDIVIVFFHGGAEGKDALHIKDSTEYFLGENRGNEFAFAHNAIDAGADLVLGSGPHVLRGLEIYKNKLIAYSLGNFLTYGNIKISGNNGITEILDININPLDGSFICGKIIPFVQAGYGMPIFDNHKNAIKLVRNLSNADFPDSRLLIDYYGNLLNPLDLKVIPGKEIDFYNETKMAEIKSVVNLAGGEK